MCFSLFMFLDWQVEINLWQNDRAWQEMTDFDIKNVIVFNFWVQTIEHKKEIEIKNTQHQL